VVDGSPLQRRLLAGRLEERGWEVVSFGHGEEALEALAAEPVDAVVSDVVLPGRLDGFQLAAALAERASAERPAVVLTPSVEPGEGDRRMAERTGARVVPRRAGFREVLEAVASALAAGARPDPGSPAAALPPEVARELAGRRVVLAGFGVAEADRAERALRSAGALPRSVGRLEAGWDGSGEVVVVSLRDGDEPVPETEDGPVVLGVGSAEVLWRAAPRGMRHLLARPWRPEALLLRVYLAARDAEPATRRASVAGAGPRDVVLADDDESITVLVAATLRNSGYRCHVAHDGHVALELIEHVRPGVAVLDVNMPRKDGFEVLAALRDGGRTRGMPVVLLTARRQELDILRGFELGAADYVVKPFNPLELAARLRRLAPVE
jgi:DNA-binding response OmpR family regulator